MIGLSLVFVVGAAVGGAVAGSRKTETKPSTTNSRPEPAVNGSSTPVPSTIPDVSNSTNPTTLSISNLLVNSKLATVNWTDSKNYQHHALFYQNRTGSLTLSLWDSENRTWAILPVFVPGLQIDATLNGTAIAASVDNNFQLNVYFYSVKQEIKEFYTKDQQARVWSKGSLTDHNAKGFPDSQLTAYNQLCASHDCCNSTVVLYQDPNQQLRYMNGSDKWSNIPTLLNTAIAPKSGMALMPFTDSNDPKKLPVVLKVYVENNELTQEFTERKGRWGGSFTVPTTKAQDPSQFAAIPIKNRGQILSDIFVATLYPNGTVAGQWNQDSNWGEATLPLTSDAERKNYNAVAMNQDQRFYGISSGQIHEYEIGGQNPLSWNYIGVVGT